MASKIIQKKRQTRGSGKAKILKFTINCSTPIKDEVFDLALFEQYLKDRVKVNGKTKNLGDTVSILAENHKINVSAKAPFAKHYLKYLTKKFLKKHLLRDYIRVISDGKGAYDLRYFKIHNQEDES